MSLPLPSCSSTKKNRGFHPINPETWRFKYKVKISDGPFDGDGKLRAWTISYRKKNGRWKKRGAYIEVLAYGTLVNSECGGGASIETAVKTKTGRRVKVKNWYASGSKAKSGEIHSSHYHEKVGLYHHTLTW